MNILEIKNLEIGFYINQVYYPAVKTLNLDLPEGEVLALIGESGCGKSLSSLAALNLLPQNAVLSETSQILLKGNPLQNKSQKELSRIRGKEMGMVFQEPMTSLNPVLKIGKQLDEIFIHHYQFSKEEAKKESLNILKKVKLPNPEELYHLYPHHLSGGMRQRVMIGIAIACKPSLLIADEPTTALDVTIQAEIMNLFETLRSESGAILFISHNLMLVKDFSDRIAIMYLGEIVEMGKSQDIFKNPLHPYTEGLMKAIPKIGGNAILKEIPGTVPPLKKIAFHSCRFYERCDKKMKKCLEIHPELKEEEESHFVRCLLYEKN
ncbi:MAG: hypothetical protein A2Y41_01400 [Spirochaetes bacterium GWB1_36_13]|nr:MAG: hypothetical protein A2Y41_01400 [Spirochaetes bacterium GWB1_36_13]